MASTAMFAPYDPSGAMARRVHNRVTNNAYQLNAQGAALVDSSDVAWFQAQGFSLAPTAGVGQTVLYAPYTVDRMARRVHIPGGNPYVFNSAGAAVIANADVPWFLAQGYTSTPTAGTGQTVVYAPLESAERAAHRIHSPLPNPYVFNGQGAAVVANADVPWFQAQGFAPAASGGVAPPVFPPVVGATQATIAADFAGSQYWASAATQASFAAWLTAIGGTYSRASSATYLQGGVVKTAAANAPRFPTNNSGVAQGIRLTGPATNVITNSNGFVASWTKQAVANTSSGIGPDGSTAASFILPDTTNGGHYTYNATPTFVSGRGTASVFLKPNGYNFGFVTISSGANRYCSVFDLTSGASTATSPSGTPTGTSFGSTVLANGWVNIWVTMDTTAGSGFIIVGPCNVGVPSFSTSVPNFIGDGVSGVLAFGGQVTQTAFPCDYIPTTTASVTQAADAFQFPFTQTTFSALVGTNGLRPNGSSSMYVIGAAGVDAPVFTSNSTNFSLFSSAQITGPTVTDIFNPHKTMVAGSPSNTWLTSDGLTPATGALGIVTATPASLFFNSNAVGAANSYGNYSQLATWNAIVASTAEMQRLTS